MTYTFTQDVVITNTTSNIGLKINQTGSNEGLQINQATNNYGLRITKTHTGTSNPLFISNAGGGYGIYEYQSAEGNGFVVNKVSTGASSCFTLINAGTGHGGYISQSGEGNAMVINKTSTGGAGGVVVLNAGIGSGFVIQQSGAGKALYINKTKTSDTAAAIDVVSSGPCNDLAISHKNTGSANVITITNSGSGADIVGHNASWQINPTGYATFNDVSVCAGIGRVHAYNTAYAGGRVHIYSRSQTINKDLHCEWGMSRTPIDYGKENTYGLYSMIDLYFAYDLYCPIVHVQPWFPAYYDEDAEDAPDWEFGVPSGEGNKTLEPSILGYIPGETPGCVAGVHLAFSQCVWGIPTSSYQSEFGPGEYDYPEDLVFDFQVLGCECEFQPV